MPIVYLILSVITCGAYSIFFDIFSRRTSNSKKTAIIYNLFICFTTCVCWGIYTIFNPGFDVRIIPYALGQGFAIFLVFLCNQIALRKNGPVSLVSLIISFSLILVAVYGLIFWEAEFSIFKGIGLCLVAASLFFIIYKKNDGKKGGWLWLILSFIAMIGNAACSIIQKSQQMAFSNQYGASFMAIATLFALMLSTILFFIKRKEVHVENMKVNWVFPVLGGLCNFALNVFVILLMATDFSPTIIYPTISMNIILVLIYSVFFKKEKLTFQQIIGVILGVIAVFLLSL